MTSEIKRLHIERFRGIRELTWHPHPGLNLMLGGGNVGKTTILEAIGLLLSPTTSYTLMDSDYLGRLVEDEFLIEAVMSLPGEINRQASMAWPWEWDGQDAVLAVAEGPEDAAPIQARQQPRPAVYKVRVRGTADLELVYEVVQPDDSVIPFSVALRREIGLVRLLGDDRSERDLRLVAGSNLDRLINDRGLRARLGREFAADSVDQHLEEQPRTRLERLEQDFIERRLPSQLGLAFTGGPGQSINSLIGLTAVKDDVVLPLATWGSGTRRLAALAIADSLQDGHPITLVDELERGLEPYLMALEGLGIAVLPGYLVADDLNNGNLVEVLSQEKLEHVDIHVVYPSRRYVPSKVVHFVEMSLGYPSVCSCATVARASALRVGQPRA